MSVCVSFTWGSQQLPLNLIDMERLDYYDILPEGMEKYLSHYGWHFSRKMCEWAVKHMIDRNGKPLVMVDKESVNDMLKQYNVKLSNDKGYDAVFVYHMGKSDYLGSSIIGDAALCQYVKDVLDDKDGYEGIAFSRFIADCNAKGEPIIWEDLL